MPFAAHRALQTCCLGALDKQPGVRPLGVGSSTKRLIAKCTLKVIGDDTKAACGNVNLCAGLEAGIEGALHAVRARAADGDKMEFGDWEVDHNIFPLTVEEGETQDSLPERRAKEARAAAVAAADPPTPEPANGIPAFRRAATAQASLYPAAAAAAQAAEDAADDARDGTVTDPAMPALLFNTSSSLLSSISCVFNKRPGMAGSMTVPS